MILGTGVDIVEIKRIRQLRKKHGERFLRHCFTAREIAYCRQKKNADESFAARFAAKEAVMKALGTGWSRGVGFTNIEVVKKPDEPPAALLHGKAAENQRQRGISHFLLSLSHCKKYAVAQAVAVSQ
ncbi:MAG: holo-ACP synthase [Planctomycetota bacterium]|jgi:holo-[acyl-carrier protein] synthase|nr:holo-ACP synthase [Planctomycetota bacterium]